MTDEVITCPLGSKCYEIKDNKAHRCAWSLEIAGKDAQGNDCNDWRCAIVWQPILMMESSKASRSTTAAVESMRNETLKRQDVALAVAAQQFAKGGDNVRHIANI